MTEDTTELSYWLNWRFFCCAAVVFVALITSVVLLFKYERSHRSHSDEAENSRRGIVYQNETWRTCFTQIHPIWLLGFRVLGFVVLLSLITFNLGTDGWSIMYYYTQWTFTLVTIYFALGCSMSIYGLSSSRERSDYLAVDVEITDTSRCPKLITNHGDSCNREIAGLFGYIFQILFQVCGGAVVITDAMFWFVIYPFLTSKDYKIDFVNTCLHSVNAVFLLGDTALNSMRYPIFRFAYFIIWTSVYVIFQWIIHACISLWWPYPFLDLSFAYSPVWYLAVGLLHIPSFGFFALLVKLKHSWLSRPPCPQSCIDSDAQNI